MRVGVMQPYFFPYIGYFSLIKNVDRFIVLDDVQFIRHGWIERNRILKPAAGWQYISVPLQKHSQKTAIKDIHINNNIEWKKRIMGQLTHYTKAPYYKYVIDLLIELFEKDYEFITELDIAAMQRVLDYLNINTPIEIFRNMGVTIDSVMAPDEWALNICKAIGDVDEYWNPPGGQSFFCKEKYERANIKLYFQQIEKSSYRQKGNEFEEGLSILDVLMFNSVAEVNQMLERYVLL